jgi:VIT1/CCC1 family predicted Fe2+/Mn2+ transporter
MKNRQRRLNMAKVTAVLITIIGLVLALDALNIYTVPYTASIVAIGWLAVGITKLIRNFSK